MDSCHDYSSFGLTSDVGCSVACALSPHCNCTQRNPLILTHLHQTWNTQTTEFNCEFHSVSGAHLCPQENPCRCARPPTTPPFFPSQFQRIYHFLCYICSKVSIWCTGLDLVASNKLLFQCCLCSGPHRRQLCGWPPWSPQGQPYI